MARHSVSHPLAALCYSESSYARGWPVSQPASCSAGHTSQPDSIHINIYIPAYCLSHVPQDCPNSAGVQGASGWYGLGPIFINRVSSMLAR